MARCSDCSNPALMGSEFCSDCYKEYNVDRCEMTLSGRRRNGRRVISQSQPNGSIQPELGEFHWEALAATCPPKPKFKVIDE